MRGGIGYAEATLVRGVIPNITGIIGQYRAEKARRSTENYIGYLEQRVQYLANEWKEEAAANSTNLIIANKNYDVVESVRKELAVVESELESAKASVTQKEKTIGRATEANKNFLGSRQVYLETVAEYGREDVAKYRASGNIKKAIMSAKIANLNIITRAELFMLSLYEQPQLLRLSEGIFRDVGTGTHDPLAEWNELADIFGEYTKEHTITAPYGTSSETIRACFFQDSIIPDPDKLPEAGLFSVLPETFLAKYGRLLSRDYPRNVIKDDAFGVVSKGLLTTVSARDQEMKADLRKRYGSPSADPSPASIAPSF